MNSIREFNRFILEQVSDGRIDENTALSIIMRIQKLQEKKPSDIAIIGMECRFAGADNKYEFWDSLMKGIHCSKSFPKGRAKDIGRKAVKQGLSEARGGFLDEIDMFDLSFFRISPNEAMMLDPFQRVFLEVAYSAIEDAGYGGRKIANTRTGVYAGVDTSNKGLYTALAGDNGFLTLTGSMNSLVASRLSYIFNLRGPSMTIDSACSSGMVALHEACMALKNDDCDMAVAGGVNLVIDPGVVGPTSAITSFDGATRSFDKNCAGFSWGEGAGVVVLKSYEKAVRDGDNIYAVIKGSAINNDGASNGITAPNPEAQTEVILKAWKDAGVHPETLSYVEAHGTGTVLGDPIEIRGITDAFAKFTDKRQFCGIGSVKTNIGHSIGAAGIASLIKIVMSLKHCVIPATINFINPNTSIDFPLSPVFVNTKQRKWEISDKPRRAGISCFGAGGTNSHVIIEEVKTNNELRVVEVNNGTPNLLTISAKSLSSFRRLAELYIVYLDDQRDICVHDMCYTANTGRGHYMYRGAVIFNDLQDLKQKLIHLCELCETESNETNIEDVYYGEHKVIRATKKTRAKNEITEGERRELGLKATSILEGHVNADGESNLFLREACELYVKGAAFDWDNLYNGTGSRRISLPTYPYDKVRCWFDTSRITEKALSGNFANVYYKTKWVEENRMPSLQNDISGSIMVIKDRGEMGTKLTEAFRKKGVTVIEVEVKDSYSNPSEHSYTISGSRSDYVRLFDENVNNSISKIVYMSTVNIENDEAKNCADLDEALRWSSYGLWNIICALSQSSLRQKLDIVLIADYANEVTGNEKLLKPENATLFGFGNAIFFENPNIRCRCIDIDTNIGMDTLTQEIKDGYSAYLIAYRNNKRYIELLEQADLSKEGKGNFKVSKDNIYIITGGAGGIGLEIGKTLAEKEKVNIVLIGKSFLPESEKWDEIINLGRDTVLCNKLKGIRDIQSKGSNVVYYSADISEYEQISEVITGVRKNLGRIAGVFHCAGVAGEKITINKQRDSIKAVLSPKVQGTWLIDHLTREDAPDFFVMCSSIATLIPNIGQADYMAANSYIDAYVQYRNRFDSNTLVVNWPLWKETGMAVNMGVDERYDPSKAITSKEGIQRLEEILGTDMSRVILFEPNSNSKTPMIIENLPIKLSNDILEMFKKLMPEQSVQNVQEKKISLKESEGYSYTETELQVASIWCEVLGISQVSVDDIFSDLGGDSIQAIKVANMVSKIKGCEINAGDVFEHLTVYEFSKHIDEQASTNTDNVVITDSCIEQDEDREYALSNSQERLWFLQKYDPDLVAYNMSLHHIFDFEINVEILTKGMELILRRHPSLRTIFVETDGIPKQVILSQPDFNIETVDLSDCDDAMEQLKDLIEKENRKPSDLSKLLLRMKHFKLNNNKNCIYFNIHHIIVDGISMGIIEGELYHVLTAFKSGSQISLPPIQTNYIDFMLEQKKWLESPKSVGQEEYWMNELALPLPILNLPTDFKRPESKTYNGDYVVITINNNLVERLNGLAREAGCTMNILLLAMYFTLLHKITCDNDIIVSIPITQRDNEELELVVGLLINTICIRCNIEDTATFKDLLLHVKDKSLKGYNNAKYPFDLIVSKLNPERDRSRTPICSTLFQRFNNLTMDSEIGSMMDISLQCMETEGIIEARFGFNTDLFKKSTVERFGGYFLEIISRVLENSDTTIAELDMLSRAEKDKLLVEFNKTRLDYPRGLTINEAIESQAEELPEQVALVFHDQTLTYREFNAKANMLAHRLREEGVGEGSIVGIMTGRSLEMMVGILGILKTGGAYLPLDPEYPADRIQYMLEDSKACVLIAQKNIDDNVVFEGKRIYVDLESFQEYEEKNLPVIHSGESPAYVIYTSGSTGKPKGVVVQHRSIYNFILGMREICAFSRDMACLCITTMSFDIFALESLLPFTIGMKVVIADEKQQLDPVALSQIVSKHNVDIIQTTPSRMQLLLGYEASRTILQQAQYILVGGEAFPPALLEDLKKVTQSRIVNMYGPTETTVWSTYKELTHENEISIGRPIANTRIYILDKHGNIQPEGVAGELCIGGDGVAMGYHNRPELTAEKFVDLPFETESKVYKTGDLAKWLPDGNIAYLGRMDNQEKIRGYRIEMGEIESCLLKHEEVKESVVSVCVDANGIKNLCAYYVSDRELTVNELKEHLQKELPDYMVPSFFTKLESLPKTSNGKVNRKALPEPSENINTGVEYKAPSNELEQELFDVWQEVLGNQRIGVDHSFFDVGGNSMMLVKLHAALDDKYPGKINIPVLFNYSTISKLAEFLSTQEELVPEASNDDESLEDEIYSMFDEIEKGSIGVDDVVQKLVSEGGK